MAYSPAVIIEWVNQTQVGAQPQHNHWKYVDEYIWDRVQRERKEGRAIYKGRGHRHIVTKLLKNREGFLIPQVIL